MNALTTLTRVVLKHIGPAGLDIDKKVLADAGIPFDSIHFADWLTEHKLRQQHVGRTYVTVNHQRGS